MGDGVASEETTIREPPTFGLLGCDPRQIVSGRLEIFTVSRNLEEANHRPTDAPMIGSCSAIGVLCPGAIGFLAVDEIIARTHRCIEIALNASLLVQDAPAEDDLAGIEYPSLL